MSQPQSTFTAGSVSEWGAEIANAREFLAAVETMQGTGKELCLRKGTVIFDMYQSLSPKGQALVQLGRLFGGPITSVSFASEVAS